MNGHSGRNGKSRASSSANPPEQKPENESLGSRIASSTAGLAKSFTARPDSTTLSQLASAGSSKAQSSASGALRWTESSYSHQPGTSSSHSATANFPGENFRSSSHNLESENELKEFLSEDDLRHFGTHGNLQPSAWQHEFYSTDQQLEEGSQHLPAVYYESGLSSGGPVQRNDGAEVSALLSRPDFQIDEDPQQIAIDEPSEQTVQDLFPQNYNAEEQEAVNRIKSTLPPPPEHKSVHPFNPMNLIPGVEDLAASLEDGEESYLNYSTPQREHWLHEWETVLESYTDKVWAHGFENLQGGQQTNFRHVEETRSRLQDVAAKKGTLDDKSVARLKMILGHVLQDSLNADRITGRRDHKEEEATENEEILIPTFHCPWISCHEVR
ncbi:hypothetical protein NA57DRAFT_58577 [Rhizodiscina lignyota]|uniref:Uncharacterized protein n=1 Tax=Rhizodiscina lignyota TaxID=1504668 RepID=A0A9P4IAW9_9PEZI|nr:hypothetical protein NA57DRAFT_58577 [Rhizodiscina lignyota]